jgi:energy-coupling factor transport system permease protein
MKKDTFSGYHPVVNFLYFTLVTLFSVIFMHPVCLLISLFSAFVYSIYLNGKKAAKFNFLYMLPMLAVTALINPVFNHEGITVLYYLANGNPLTLESIAYGIAAAAMLISVICWFSCYNAVMTSDKFIYLFGRVIPALSLVLSMTLRFVPKFRTQLTAVSNAQKCIGRDASGGSIFKRYRQSIRILSIMVTWMMENAIETADAMKSRGYGLRGRTAFSVFTFGGRDKKAVLALFSAAAYILAGAFLGGKALYYRYFPSMRGGEMSVYTVSVFLVYAVLCCLPVIINILEERKWKLLQSAG